jgi:LAO/AO transport system kinase
MASADPSLDEIVRGVRAGERIAVARALNLVEDRREASRERVEALLAALGDGRADSLRVGFTGPPGVGKSTLVAAVIRALRARGKSVGVVAVDPSSRRTGGALLGDRARIDTDPGDEGVFVRSLATRGELGGLARAAPADALVMSAAFDWVIVETVGVGQSETDVEHVVDNVVFVVQPGSGDALQFLKAGIMEIPDVLAVNKSDLGDAAKRARADLANALGAARAVGISGAWDPPVVLTSAARREGIDELIAAIETHRAHLAGSGELRERRVRGRVEWLVREYVRRHGEIAVAREGGEGAVRARFSLSRPLRAGEE